MYNPMDYAVEQLKLGNDEPLRTLTATKIEHVLELSAKGEIGYGTFIDLIRAPLILMEQLCLEYFKP